MNSLYTVSVKLQCELSQLDSAPILKICPLSLSGDLPHPALDSLWASLHALSLLPMHWVPDVAPIDRKLLRQLQPQRRPGTCRRFRFTNTAISELPPHPQHYRAGQTEYRDAEVSGLCLSVGRSGKKHFHCRYRFRGKKRNLVLGDFPSVSIKEARDRVHEAKAAIARGIDPAAERAKRDATPVFSDFAVDYLEWARAHKGTWRDDDSKLRKELLPRFGRAALDAISPREIQQMHVQIQSRSSNSNANRYLALLKRMFSLACEWEIIKRNPARAVKKVKENSPRDRVLSTEEIRQFLSALERLENKSVAAGLRFLLYTGLRKNEAFRLEWKYVDRERGTVYLSHTKSGKPRLVLLNTLARAVIEERWAARVGDHPFVFPGRRQGQAVNCPKVSFVAACENAAIKGVCIHTLRHTFASVCVSTGVPLYDVQKLLGHASSQMTQRYAHLEDASVRRATEVYADRITAMLTGDQNASRPGTTSILQPSPQCPT